MADETFTFDEDGAARIVDAVRQVEKMRVGPAAKSSVRGGPRGNSVAVVRVTSTTPASGLYPTQWEYYSGGAWSDGGAAWVVGSNGLAPAVGRYLGILIGTGSDGSPLFSVDDAFGGSLEVKQNSGGTDCTDTTVLFFDQTQGFTVAQPSGAGTATVSITPASATVPGIVTTGAQTIAGAKNFTSQTSVLSLIIAPGNSQNTLLPTTGTSPFTGSSEGSLVITQYTGGVAGNAITIWSEGIDFGSGKLRSNGNNGVSSHTVTLAKLTVGGTNGSMTITNGLVAGVVDPT